MTIQTPCPCCGHNNFFEVLSFPATPISGFFRKNAEDLLPNRDLIFEACFGCGLLRNRNFSSPLDYSNRPRPTARQLPDFRDHLLNLISSTLDKDDLILEIGSNDGCFLDFLQSEGFSNICGVEPSSELVRTSRSKGHRIFSAYFGTDLVGPLLAHFGPPKLVICRHTLEHVPDPFGFVQALRDILVPANGVALVEVPDSTAILDGVNFVELWDEHLFYFTPATMGLIMERNGLQISTQMTFKHLETRNILINATLGGGSFREISDTSLTSEANLWKEFSNRFCTLSNQIKKAICTAPKPIYIIGASHPQSNFVNFLNLGLSVDFMIDDDLAKVGKLPPINSHCVQIISSDDFLRHDQGGTLVLTAFGYLNWARQLSDIALSKGMSIIDPRSFVS